MNYSMDKDIAQVLISEAELAEMTKRIGAEISADFAESKKLVLLCILKGSTPFFADLMRAITIPCEIEFMRVSSYSGTESTGKLNIRLDMSRDDMAECDIVVIEDIIDSGNTLYKLKAYLEEKGPRSLKICTLLDKPECRVPEIKDKLKTDYKGAEIPDEFVVGYGLDYNERYRNLPYVGVLKREVYEK